MSDRNFETQQISYEKKKTAPAIRSYQPDSSHHLGTCTGNPEY